jgi:putative ABC transport system permease protein
MSILTDALERVRALVFRRRDERELDEELGFHLAMEAELKRREGLSPDEARRRGLVALGGVERTKEEFRDARGTRFLEDGLSDLAFTLRTLSRSPGFALVAILTLAIGIGGTTAVFSAVDAVLLQPLPYQQPGQLVRLYQYGAGHPDKGHVTPVHYLAYRAGLASLEATAATYTYSERGADVGGSDRPERIRLLPVSAEYFNVVRVSPRIGRAFQANEENGAPVVILSHALWERRLAADPAAVGRAFTMSGTPYTVVGVMPAGFADPVAGEVGAWVPLDLTEGRDASNVDNHYLTILGRLRAGTTLTRAQAELDLLGASLAKQYPTAKDARAQLYPLKEDIVGPASRSLEIMLGAVVLVLLLVCVNIANLLLVRGSDRAREFALRSALGADRTRLVRQLLIESVTLALAGDVAGLLLARGAMSAIVALGAGSIPRLASLSLEPRLLAFSVGVATLSAILFGLAPALRAARTHPSDVLREQARTTAGSSGQSRLRAGLVVSQVALAFVLLVGAGLLLASFQRLRQVPLGVNTNGVLTFELELPGARYDSTARVRFYENLSRQLETLPGVRAAGGVSRLPGTGVYHMWGTNAMTGPLVGTKAGSAKPTPQQRVVAGDYFRALGIPVLTGRLFDARDDNTVPHRVIVSKGLADRIFPGMDAVGQRVNAGGRESDIIGVVPDVAVNAEGDTPMYVYHTHNQMAGDRNWPLVQVVATNGAPQAIEPQVRRALAGLDPELVMYRPTSLADAVGRGTASRVFTLRILTSFAVVALALAALGLFGVLSYGVRMRAQEFGIRMALGAGRGSIRTMVLRQGLVVAGIGVGIGLAGAIAMSSIMRSLVFGVSPLDPRVLGVAVLFMGLVAAIAAYLPAHRATAVDPRRVLQ